MDRRSPPTRVGALVDGYQLIARRDDQGLGESWFAQRPHQADDEVIVKFVAPVDGDNAPLPASFDETLRKVQRATASGLVNVRRWGVFEGWIHVVTEVIEARPLDDWFAGHREAGTRPPPGVVLWLFDRLCSAVHSAHRQGLVHGALSPASVLLHPLSPGSYHGWILDLGLAPWIVEASLVSAIEPPSPMYLAPEQLEAKAQTTTRSDVFSLALMLVEMLTLTATPGSTRNEPFARIAAREHPRLVEHLRRLQGDILEDFWGPLAEALHPDPAVRPENAQQLKTRVRDAARRVSLWRDVPEPVPEPPVPTRRSGGAGEVAVASRAQASVPEGWQHAERQRVDPEAAKAALSIAARRRRATSSGLMPVIDPARHPAIAAPPPTRPTEDADASTTPFVASPARPAVLPAVSPIVTPRQALPPAHALTPDVQPFGQGPGATQTVAPGFSSQKGLGALGAMRLAAPEAPDMTMVPQRRSVPWVGVTATPAPAPPLAPAATHNSFADVDDPFDGTERRPSLSDMTLAPDKTDSVLAPPPDADYHADATVKPASMTFRSEKPLVQRSKRGSKPTEFYFDADERTQFGEELTPPPSTPPQGDMTNVHSRRMVTMPPVRNAPGAPSMEPDPFSDALDAGGTVPSGVPVFTPAVQPMQPAQPQPFVLRPPGGMAPAQKSSRAWIALAVVGGLIVLAVLGALLSGTP